mmetsp:Transcript_169/g.300  ORF Transcript_169/g.300 Transcript_169/m.300 type:complete len:201 (-) Transcript_169:74-676(-)
MLSTRKISGLSVGLTTSISRIRLHRACDLPGGMVYLPKTMDSFASPANGSLPNISTYSRTPRAQMSALQSMRCRVYRSHISGARYAGVVLRRMFSSSAAISAWVSYTWALVVALPKSASTQRPSALRRTFSAFRSLCATGGFCRCMCATALHTSEKTVNTVRSSKLKFDRCMSSSKVPGQYSKSMNPSVSAPEGPANATE